MEFLFPRLADIPPEFHSDETGEPFECCLICERSLMDYDGVYLVEKAYRTFPNFDAKDLIFEYAICHDCAEQMMEAFSDESREAIELYFETRIDEDTRARQLLADEAFDADASLAICAVNGTPRADLNEYQLIGAFTGGQMIVYTTPMMLSSAVLDEVTMLLSKATRDELGGFMAEHLPQPPGLDKDVPVPPVLIF